MSTIQKQIKYLSGEELYEYLRATKNSSSVKLSDELEKEDINGNHLSMLTIDEMESIGKSIGMRKDLEILINRVNELVIVPSRPASVQISSPNNSIYAEVTKDSNGQTKDTPQRIYLSSQNGFDFSSLEDGKYISEFLIDEGFSAPLSLSKQKFTKIGDLFDPSFFDLSTSDINVNFLAYDKPLSNSKVIGTLVQKDDKNMDIHISINSTTDANGNYKSVVPPSKLDLQANGKVDGKDVEIKQSFNVLKPKPVKSLLEALNVDPVVVNASSNCSMYNINSTKMNSLALLDTSGSMQSAGQPQLLKKGSINYLNHFLKGKNISIASWNDSTNWFGKPGDFITAQSFNQAKNWIENLKMEGGTGMKQAIASALFYYGNKVEEIFILCDGDTSSFGDGEWVDFIKPYPNIKFSFIAIGATASHTSMQIMAQQGNGSYGEEK